MDISGSNHQSLQPKNHCLHVHQHVTHYPPQQLCVSGNNTVCSSSLYKDVVFHKHTIQDMIQQLSKTSHPVCKTIDKVVIPREIIRNVHMLHTLVTQGCLYLYEQAEVLSLLPFDQAMRDGTTAIVWSHNNAFSCFAPANHPFFMMCYKQYIAMIQQRIMFDHEEDGYTSWELSRLLPKALETYSKSQQQMSQYPVQFVSGAVHPHDSGSPIERAYMPWKKVSVLIHHSPSLQMLDSIDKKKATDALFAFPSLSHAWSNNALFNELFTTDPIHEQNIHIVGFTPFSSQAHKVQITQCARLFGYNSTKQHIYTPKSLEQLQQSSLIPSPHEPVDVQYWIPFILLHTMAQLDEQEHVYLCNLERLHSTYVPYSLKHTTTQLIETAPPHFPLLLLPSKKDKKIVECIHPAHYSMIKNLLSTRDVTQNDLYKLLSYPLMDVSTLLCANHSGTRSFLYRWFDLCKNPIVRQTRIPADVLCSLLIALDHMKYRMGATDTTPSPHYYDNKTHPFGLLCMPRTPQNIWTKIRNNHNALLSSTIQLHHSLIHEVQNTRVIIVVGAISDSLSLTLSQGVRCPITLYHIGHPSNIEFDESITYIPMVLSTADQTHNKDSVWSTYVQQVLQYIPLSCFVIIIPGQVDMSIGFLEYMIEVAPCYALDTSMYVYPINGRKTSIETSVLCVHSTLAVREKMSALFDSRRIMYEPLDVGLCV